MNLPLGSENQTFVKSAGTNNAKEKVRKKPRVRDMKGTITHELAKTIEFGISHGVALWSDLRLKGFVPS